MKGIKEYITWFSKEHGYIFCLNEDCEAPNQPPHAPHHIYKRSFAVKHPELHNHRNLIMLCQKCHNVFHHGNTDEDFANAKKWQERWVEERKLNKLFGRE